ncbi:MAG: aminotransferase class I/II-fold pyridoxal phosphate-dependent enzyme, partial [Cyanobacteria bacterium J06632_19]
MASKNPVLSQLTIGSTYNELFNREIIGRVKTFQASYPQKKIYMMAWGDTSQPLPPKVVRALIDGSTKLGNFNTYTGYENINGNPELKKAICHNYYQKKLNIKLDTSEIFISDGAQSSSANLQELFGLDNSVALQNPTYPSFIEGNLLAGR